MKKHKILFGVCGIGNGHTERQLPLVEYFLKKSKIVIFAYDSSYEFYSKYFDNNPDISVLNVAVPFYVGSRNGIDFDATDNLAKNKKDYAGINKQAMAKAEEIIGTPDLVISDYEPISAEYAYKYQSPLVTIDQQSKYLTGEFPAELYGETYADEVARLKMFFPTASARIACSFFDVKKKKEGEDVLIFPPILKESVTGMKNVPVEPVSFLVYLSSQKQFPQSPEDVIEVFSSQPEVQFHIFISGQEIPPSFKNITFYKHGDEKFAEVLQKCTGIVSTAGHTLLSEAMYLGIPAYAIPLLVYEQQMNAEIVGANAFGVRAETLNKKDLEYFILNNARFRNAIKTDMNVLLRGDGKGKIISFLEERYLS